MQTQLFEYTVSPSVFTYCCLSELGCSLAHGKDVEEGGREGGICRIMVATTPGAAEVDPSAAPLASPPFPQEALLRERSSSSEEKSGRQRKEDGREKSQERQTDRQMEP